MTRAATTGDDKERIFIDQSLIVTREKFSHEVVFALD